MKRIINLLAVLLVTVMLLTSCSYVTDVLFPPDYKQITNDIFTKYIEMNVVVLAEHENKYYGLTNQGSGVIYGEESGYYYCLTNAHVVEYNDYYADLSFYVMDCYGYKYNATLIHADRNRDLAVVRFKYGNERLYVADLAESDPREGENVIAISSSEHIMNSVTYGKIKGYDKIKIYDDKGNDDTRVTFDVIRHDAHFLGGGSGSALLNLDMELVGINYATSTDRDGIFVWGYAVSVSHIREYLEENHLMK